MNPFSSSMFGNLSGSPPLLTVGGTTNLTATCPSSISGTRGISSTSAARDQADEFNNWKLHCPLLYDYLATHVLIWPSLTVEILPNLPSNYQSPLQDELKDDTETIQTLLLGTHTAEGEDNSVILMDVIVPNESVDPENRMYETHEDYAGFGYGTVSQKFHIRMTIPHLIGESNRIRSMPHDRAVFATISVGGAVTVFDARDKFASHALSSPSSNDSLYSISLLGHDKEGWGLSWSPYNVGCLATAADDMKVCIWDTQIRPKTSELSTSLSSSTSQHLRQSSFPSSSITPLLTLQKHTASVQDVTWSPSQETVLVSVGDDGKLILWDTRIPTSSTAQEVQCSSSALNTISISSIRPTLLSTGGADREVLLLDMRKLNNVLYKMAGHEQMISRVEFCPTSERFIASCGGNRSVLLWDLYSIGKEQTPEDASEGPPELLFSHCGHLDVVNDISWNPNPGFEHMIASVSDDNQLHLWCMSKTVYGNSESEDEEEDDGFEVE